MKAANYKTLPDFYEFGPYRLDTRDLLLFKNDEEVHLTPKVIEILLALLKRHGHVVEKEELMEEVWPDTIVEDNNLTRNISTLRKALNADYEVEEEDYFIETIPRRGYRFVAEVRERRAFPSFAETVVLAGESPESEIGPDTELASGTPAVAALPEAATVRTEGNEGLLAARPESYGVRASRFFKRPKPVTLLNSLFLLIIASLLFRQMRLLDRIYGTAPKINAGAAFSNLHLTRHSGKGAPLKAALSHDGKSIVYVASDETGQQSLYFSQVNTNNAIQLVPPREPAYQGLSFAPDGRHIYFTRREENQTSVLYRLAVLGDGPPQKLASLGASSHVGLSPDGTRIAFVREQTDAGTSALMIANINGSAERKLVERNLPEFFSLISAPSWSADGQFLACVVGSMADGIRYRVATIPMSREAALVIHAAQWSWIDQATWLPDGQGLLILADEQPGGWHDQLWFMTWPGEKLSRITNDLSDYSGISPAADSNSLVTVQRNHLSDLWVVPYRTGGRSQRMTPNNDRRDGLHGLDWTLDGHLVFTSLECDREQIWSMSPDGSQRYNLTTAESSISNNHSPAVSPDGRSVVFVSDRQGSTRIWRMDIDGAHPTPLTDGHDDLDPQVSSDGQWVIYSSVSSGKRTLWKIPLAGGTSTAVTDLPAEAPAAAPYDNLIACAWREVGANPQRKLAVVDLGGRQPPRFFAYPDASPLIRWMPDERALSYGLIRDGIANLWSQPLSGKQPRRITDLSFENIASFAWSRDGKRLALARTQEIRSIVFISDLK